LRRSFFPLAPPSRTARSESCSWIGLPPQQDFLLHRPGRSLWGGSIYYKYTIFLIEMLLAVYYINLKNDSVQMNGVRHIARSMFRP
jgi:hypothetical protein